jgi:prepilin-type N-terminal cleavage/methylation domain-containing protein
MKKIKLLFVSDWLLVKREGFTMIELLITIGLVAILSSAVLSMIGPQSQRFKRDTRRQADLQNIASALELYRNDKSGYPTSGNYPSGLTAAPSYISSIPTDPKDGSNYTYTGSGSCATTCTRFSLCATLENNGTASNFCVTNP